MSAETPPSTDPPQEPDCSPGDEGETDVVHTPRTAGIFNTLFIFGIGAVVVYGYMFAPKEEAGDAEPHEHGPLETFVHVAVAVFVLAVLMTGKTSNGFVAVAGLAAVTMPLMLVWRVVADQGGGWNKHLGAEQNQPPSDAERKRQQIPDEAVFVSKGVTHDIYKMEETPGKWVEFHAIHMYRPDGTIDAERIRAYREAVAKPDPNAVSMCSIENPK